MCFPLICNLLFPCECKLEMGRADGRSAGARLSFSPGMAPSALAEERTLLDAHGQVQLRCHITWCSSCSAWWQSHLRWHRFITAHGQPPTSRRVRPCRPPKPNHTPPKAQSKQTWGRTSGPGAPKTDSQLCQGGSAKDDFPGKIKPNHGLESCLPANISMPHLLL